MSCLGRRPEGNLKVHSDGEVKSGVLHGPRFDAPGVVQPDEVSEQQGAHPHSVAHHDGIPEVVHADGHVVVGFGPGIQRALFVERVDTLPGSAGIKKSDHLEVPNEVGLAAAEEVAQNRASEFGIEERVAVAVAGIHQKAPCIGGNGAVNEVFACRQWYGIVKAGHQPVVCAAQHVQDLLFAEGSGTGQPPGQYGVFEYPLVMADVKAHQGHKAFVGAEAGAVGQADLEALYHLGEDLVAGAVFDVERHVERVVENVFCPQAKALGFLRRHLQGVQVGGQGLRVVHAQGGRAPQAGENVERIAHLKLAQYDDVVVFDRRRCRIGGEAEPPAVHGVVLIEAFLAVFENDEIFCPVEGGRHSHARFKLIVFQ